MAALTAAIPSSVHADGRYQLVQSCVIDTQTGAVWCLEHGDGGKNVLAPLPYRGANGKTLTATPPSVGATADDPLGIR